MDKTTDTLYRYQGYFGCRSECRLEIYQSPGQTPVVIVTELPTNLGTSVTNMAEYLAADVMREYLRGPSLVAKGFDEVVWIENYPRVERRDEPLGGEWSRAIFDSYTPTETHHHAGGGRRWRLGEPEWRHITQGEVEEMIGHRLGTAVQRQASIR